MTLAQLQKLWVQWTKTLSPEQIKKLQVRFAQMRKRWLSLTPAQRQAAIAAFKNEVVKLRNAAAQRQDQGLPAAWFSGEDETEWLEGDSKTKKAWMHGTVTFVAVTTGILVSLYMRGR